MNLMAKFEKYHISILSGEQKLSSVCFQGEHFPRKWDNVTNLNARKNVLENYSRCSLCLKTGQLTKSVQKTYLLNF